MKRLLYSMLLLAIAGDIYAVEAVSARPGMVVINEAASTGAFEFIELKNTTDSTIIFDSSWSLIDSKEGRLDGDSAVRIPRDTRIPPGGFLTIAPYKSGGLLDAAPKGLPAGVIPVKAFALGSVDSVSLFYGDTLVDHVGWKTSVNTIGRDPDDPSEFIEDLVPTPDSENRKDSYYSGVPLPIVINEICSKGIDYIELYNTSDSPYRFDSDDWTIHDIGRNDHFVIPDGTVLDPHALLVIYPDLLRLPLSAHANSLPAQAGSRFGLSERDSVFLLYQGRVVERVSWFDHVTSKGRYPDGSGNWVNDLFLTPGRPNRD